VLRSDSMSKPYSNVTCATVRPDTRCTCLTSRSVRSLLGAMGGGEGRVSSRRGEGRELRWWGGQSFATRPDVPRDQGYHVFRSTHVPELLMLGPIHAASPVGE
jgi:hypothetical protein